MRAFGCVPGWSACLVVLALVGVLPRGALAQELIYRVEPGDTLMALGVALLRNPGDWVELQRINKVRDPRRLSIGKELRIPYALLRPFPRSAEVEAVAGDARIDGRAAAAGDRVGAGSVLDTGDDGHLAIALPDGSRLIVPARSTATISTLQGYAGTDEQSVELSLRKGRVESRVAPQRGPAARYRVDTPTAVIGVRGTDFRAGFEPDSRRSRAEVVSGSVGLRPLLGGALERRVEHGFGLITGAGAASGLVPLLPPPRTDRLPVLFERPLLRIPMPELDGARAWRAQVVRADAPLPVLYDQRVEDGIARVAGLPDGEYRLLVRGIDANGLEGFDASHAFRLKARPEPPFNGAPAEGAKVPAGGVTLNWTHAPEAARYVVELAPLSDSAADPFAAALLHDGTASVSLRTTLAAGTYVWRVASVREDGDRGPWSDPVSFTVRPLQELSEPPEIGEHEMAFRWVGEAGQRFEYQFSDDERFARILKQGATEAPELVLPKPSVGTYYLRIRAIDPDGYVNAWSGVQRVELPPPWWYMLLPLIAL